MNYKFSLRCISSLPLEDGFSLDELVIETKRMFETEGMAGLVGLIAELLDWIVYQSLLGKWDQSDPGRCCAQAHYAVHSRTQKSIRSSVGSLKCKWTRIRCQGCGKSFVPLRGYLNVDQHRRKTSELEKVVAEVVSEQSYRRSSQSSFVEDSGKMIVWYTNAAIGNFDVHHIARSGRFEGDFAA